MTASNARRGSPLPPRDWLSVWWRVRRYPRRKGRWQRADVFAGHGGWDYDWPRYARANTKRRAIEDQRG